MNNRDDGLTLDVLGKVSFGVPTMRLILNDRDLFADKEYFQRKEILLRVVKQWELLSGEKLAITSVTGAFKACMKRTPESVQFEALGGNGIYRRVPVLADLTVQAAQSLPRTVQVQARPRQVAKPPSLPNSQILSRSQTEPLTAPESVRNQWSDDGPAERNLGNGSARVYAWCHAADAKGDDGCWPIKVGHTGKGGLKSRLDRSQMKEAPRYLLCIRFQSEAEAISLEKALHTCLNFRGRRCRESLGIEWFLTSSQELVELAQMINPNLKEWHTPSLPIW